MITNVIIPVLNRYDLLEECVDSLPIGLTTVIIDNGDSLIDEAYYPVARVVRLPSNLGVPASWNLGIKLYPFAPGWLLLNSDARFEEGAFAEFEAECDSSRIVLAGSPPWCCAWIGRDVVDRVGLFCEAYYPAYNEDVDYEERARRLGVNVTFSHARVTHQNSSTIHSDPELQRKNALTHARNNQTHAARWHGLAPHEVPAPMDWSLHIRMANAWDS